MIELIKVYAHIKTKKIIKILPFLKNLQISIINVKKLTINQRAKIFKAASYNRIFRHFKIRN